METQTTTTTTHTETTSALHFQVNLNYIKTIPGILKIVEIVLSIITFGCAVGSNYGNGMGWVSFVAITGFIQAIFYLLLHLFVVLHHKWNVLIELIVYAIWTLFFLISGIVAAALASQSSRYWNFSYQTMGAASAFAFFSMVAWGIDTVLQAMNVRITWSNTNTTTEIHATTVNTTATRFEGNPQY